MLLVKSLLCVSFKIFVCLFESFLCVSLNLFSVSRSTSFVCHFISLSRVSFNLYRVALFRVSFLSASLSFFCSGRFVHFCVCLFQSLLRRSFVYVSFVCLFNSLWCRSILCVSVYVSSVILCISIRLICMVSLFTFIRLFYGYVLVISVRLLACSATLYRHNSVGIFLVSLFTNIGLFHGYVLCISVRLLRIERHSVSPLFGRYLFGVSFHIYRSLLRVYFVHLCTFPLHVAPLCIAIIR